MSTSRIDTDELFHELFEILEIDYPDTVILLKPFPDLPDGSPHPQRMAIESQADELFYGGAAGGGKALSVNITIPTPNGNTKMGDLQVGDQVYGFDGRTYNVLAKTEVMYGHRVFDVEFDDGSTIRADANHNWYTLTESERSKTYKQTEEYRAKRRASRPSRGTGKRPDLAKRNSATAATYQSPPVFGQIRTTLEILETLRVRGRTNHSVPVAAPLQHPEKELPVDPYCMGYWLGNGTHTSGGVTVGTHCIDEVKIHFAAAGFPLSDQKNEFQHTALGMLPYLREAGVIGDKHLPETYFTASVEQRIALIQGFMDSDGTVCDGGQVEYYSTRRGLAEDVSRILSGLGIKNFIATKIPPKGTDYTESYRIKFVASFPVFRLNYKKEKQNLDLRETQKYRYIVDVREVPSEPVCCIEVNSPDHLYLAGESHIPTHNSFLLLILAISYFYNSIIYRRQKTEIKSFYLESREILIDTRATYNKNDHVWEGIPGDRRLEFGGVQYDKDFERYQGHAHDLTAFDEITSFTQLIYQTLTIWNRTSRRNHKPRIVATGNPPTTEEGAWVVDYWGAWLNPEHPNPAKDGELRWYVTDGGKTIELMSGDMYTRSDGKKVKPRSRSFIHADVEHNIILMENGYAAQLDALPEELYQKFRLGNFFAKTEENPFQCIPTKYVIEAQERWEEPSLDVRYVACGIDVARGGKDDTVLAPFDGRQIDSLVCIPGENTPTGLRTVQLADKYLLVHKKTMKIYIDANTWGADAYQQFKIAGYTAYPVNASVKTNQRDLTRKFEFFNLRAQLYWRARELLRPEADFKIALPKDRQLLIELCAFKFSIENGKIRLEEKADVKKRLGRSPDRADAVVMALMHAGQRASAGVLSW